MSSNPKVEEIRKRLDHFLPLSDMQGRYLLTKLDEADERERVLLAGVEYAAEKLKLPYPGQSRYSPLNNSADWTSRADSARVILSRLLTSTPTEGSKNDE